MNYRDIRIRCKPKIGFLEREPAENELDQKDQQDERLERQGIWLLSKQALDRLRHKR
ncbi:MAG TPA: hypothetical protein VGJ04_04130 [Pirellulales bacterium]